MNIIVTILLTIAGIVALLLIIALFMRKKHYVNRNIVINVPRQKAFDYIKLLKNQDEFNKGAMADPDRKRVFKGTDGNVGYIYSWSGNKEAGEGEKEIMKLVEGERIETEIRFVKPMKVSAYTVMTTESLSDDQTRISWSNAGLLKFPFNIMIPMMEKMIAKDMDSSLVTLKNILEK